MDSGTLLTLDVEKPTAGGRMLARHEGRVVLVWGAIPGERVTARVERVGKGVAYATTEGVVSASPDRRPVLGDWRCGGSVLAHVAYPRQVQIKGEIIRDAFARIARLPIGEPPSVVPSPETGYRLRARLHVRDGRLGFYREETHELCDAAATGQLSADTCAWIAGAQASVERHQLAGLTGIEIAESLSGGERACHLELEAGTDPRAFAPLADGLVGLSATRADDRSATCLAGVPAIVDVLHGRAGDRSSAFRLRRHVRAFFQGNRFLLEPLRAHVVSRVESGPVADLYAGVGLFGLSLAAAGAERVTLVEGDSISGADLEANAAAFGTRVRVARQRVESFLAARRDSGEAATCIVDPPRTGMSKEAIGGLIRLRPGRIVYVSCDVATLARDARMLVDAGYEVAGLSAFDLFPNTAHVEVVAVFET